MKRNKGTLRKTLMKHVHGTSMNVEMDVHIRVRNRNKGMLEKVREVSIKSKGTT